MQDCKCHKSPKKLQKQFKIIKICFWTPLTTSTWNKAGQGLRGWRGRWEFTLSNLVFPSPSLLPSPNQLSQYWQECPEPSLARSLPSCLAQDFTEKEETFLAEASVKISFSHQRSSVPIGGKKSSWRAWGGGRGGSDVSFHKAWPLRDK